MCLDRTTQVDAGKIPKLHDEQQLERPETRSESERDGNTCALEEYEGDHHQQYLHREDRTRDRPRDEMECGCDYQDQPLRRIGRR